MPLNPTPATNKNNDLALRTHPSTVGQWGQRLASTCQLGAAANFTTGDISGRFDTTMNCGSRAI